MKKFLVLLLMFVANPNFVNAQAAQTSSFSPVILGYYPASAVGVTSADINLRLFTHIWHAFVTVDTLGNVEMEPGIANSDLVARAHAVGVKVLISVGGPNSGQYFNALVNEADSIKHLVDSVVAIVLKYHYDGVDVDWEFPALEAHEEGMVSFIALLRQQLDHKVRGSLIVLKVPSGGGGLVSQTVFGGAIVGYLSNTTITQPGQGPERLFDDAKLIPLVDFLNVMAYDFHEDGISTGHNSNLFHDPQDRTPESYSVYESMELWSRKGWPKQRLVVGIPCNGHSFHTNHITVKENVSLKTVRVPFKDILKLIAQGWKNSWEKDAYAPLLFSPNEKEYITYDSPQSAQLKGQWARQQGYRGVFFSDITQDAVNKDNVLARAARTGWASK